MVGIGQEALEHKPYRLWLKTYKTKTVAHLAGPELPSTIKTSQKPSGPPPADRSRLVDEIVGFLHSAFYSLD